MLPLEGGRVKTREPGGHHCRLVLIKGLAPLSQQRSLGSQNQEDEKDLSERPS